MRWKKANRNARRREKWLRLSPSQQRARTMLRIMEPHVRAGFLSMDKALDRFQASNISGVKGYVIETSGLWGGSN